MRERTRKTLLVVSWGLLVVSASVLVGLMLGRPIFYTDGVVERPSMGLADASMLAWDTPQPLTELPGTVRGRAARLPDGTFVYGMETEDGTTDLVRFDPERPELPPEPLFGVNSDEHDLAPALGADGLLYFASDREGGQGGFDIYSVRFAGEMFLDVQALDERVNSELDETDPAPCPLSQRLVFVRRDPGLLDGANAALYRLEAESAEASPLFPMEMEKRAARRALDRDPAFSPDGVHLWFVRAVGRQPAAIMRTWRLGGRFATPVAEDVLGDKLRGPEPELEGDGVLLLDPKGEQTLVYRSEAYEVYPWWPGQRPYELVALGVLLVALLLLFLLYMGRRWHALDLVAQCLFLSLFLHLLLLLWLSQMEVLHEFFDDSLEEGGFEVQLVSGSLSSSSANGQQSANLSAMARFDGHQRDLAVAAPGAEVELGERGERAAPDAEWAMDAEERAVEAEAELADAAEAAPTRSGEDQRGATQARDVSVADAMSAEVDAGKDGVAQSTFQVTEPSVSLGAAQRDAAARGRAAQPVVAEGAPRPVSREVTGPSTSARDAVTAGSVAALRQGTDERGAVSVDRAAAPARPQAAAAEARRSPGEGMRVGSAVSPTQRSELVAAKRRDSRGPSGPVAPKQRATRGQVAVQDAPSAADLAAAAPRGVAEENRPALTASAAGEVSQPQAAATTGRRATTPGAAMRGGTTAARPTSDLAAARRRSGPGATRRMAMPGTRSAPKPLMAQLRDGPKGAKQSAPAGTADASPARPGLSTVAELADPRSAADPTVRRDASLNRANRPGARAAIGSDLARAGRRGPRAIARPRPMARRSGPSAGVKLDDSASTGADSGVAKADQAPGSGGAASAKAAVAPLTGPRSMDPLVAAASRSPSRGERLQPGLRIPGSALDRAPKRQDGGVPMPALAQKATPYSNRFGPAKAKALEKFGGTAETERAVANGLAYLAGIQKEDGSWGNRRRRDNKYGYVHVGKTGLCLLAFLGAGHTPTSRTEYSGVARKAVDFLLSTQRESGAFGRTSSYSHGVATYALAECYGLTKDDRLVEPVRVGLEWILEHQGPRSDRRSQGGWGYFSDSMRSEDTYPRASVTAWMVMALESARLAGFELPEDALVDARSYLLGSFDRRGWFRYNHRSSRLNSVWPTLPASTPASAFALMLTGVETDDYRLRAAAEYTVERRPRAFRRYSDDDFVLRGQGNVYFYYYGSLCCFLMGGDVWDEWNASLKQVLPAAQLEDGSWPVIDIYADRYAADTREDRSYTTAMCVLSLEVYYRYFTPLLMGR